MFMNNGGFRIFPEPPKIQRPTTKRASLINAPKEEESTTWNARDEMRLLDAIEQYGYGNWKDIANHIGKIPHFFTSFSSFYQKIAKVCFHSYGI